MHGDTLSAERVIDAPADRIFALLADAGKHPVFDGSGTVRGTTEQSVPLELGTRFGMSMKMGLPYSTVNRVVELEPDRRIAWQTKAFWGLVGGRIWRYELEPSGDSTLVRETWDLSQDKQAALIKRSSMPRSTEKALSATLERIATAVEA